ESERGAAVVPGGAPGEFGASEGGGQVIAQIDPKEPLIEPMRPARRLPGLPHRRSFPLCAGALPGRLSPKLGALGAGPFMLTMPSLRCERLQRAPAVDGGMTGRIMREFATTSIAAPGGMNVDFEERVDFDRLRRYRLDRAREALERSDLGAVLCFDMNNIRYLTSTNIGEWARDKLMRFAVLTRTGEPVLWDFGSAAKAHRLHSPWLRPENSRAGMTGLRGSVAPEAGFFARAARGVKAVLDDQG